jgi:hypothetical protein
MAMVCRAWWRHTRALPTHRGLLPPVPLPAPETREWQLQISVRCERANPQGGEGIVYDGASLATRDLVVAASSSVYDFLRAVMLAFGLQVRKALICL